MPEKELVDGEEAEPGRAARLSEDEGRGQLLYPWWWVTGHAGQQFPGRSGRQRQMGGSELVVRKSVGGENTRELQGGTEGRRVVWKGGARHVGVGEVGQRMRVAVRNWGWYQRSPPRAPHPGQAQSDALPFSTLLLLTTVLGGRYYHQSADEETVREAYHGLGGKMAGERCPGSGCSSRL